MATFKVKQVKSRINAPKDQKATLLALGLRKIGQVVEIEDTQVTAEWFARCFTSSKK